MCEEDTLQHAEEQRLQPHDGLHPPESEPVQNRDGRTSTNNNEAEHPGKVLAPEWAETPVRLAVSHLDSVASLRRVDGSIGFK